MIPALLSSNLCSLRGGVDRFALSCIWELTPDAQIVSTRFCKSIICSDAAMMYSEAQMAIDDAADQRPVAQGLRILMALAKVLRQRRLDNGALLLASTETRFAIESETNDPVSVSPKKQYDTNFMVEEFMLLANISVARAIFEHFPTCAMLRNHPAPPASNFEPLVQAVRTAYRG
jgi:exosome complex exonuclease DIS3/RRP44